MNVFYIIMIFFFTASNTHSDEPKIEAYKSPFYVGRTVMACGNAVQISKSKKAFYINLDKAYPKQTLAIHIWANNIKGFDDRFGSIYSLKNKRVCARGEISEYKNSLQLKVSNPQYLRLMK